MSSKKKDSDNAKSADQALEAMLPVEGTPESATVPSQPAADAPQQPPAPEAAASPAGKQHAELEGRFLRLAADFDNFRKRTARDRDETARQAREELLLQILPAVDDLSRGLRAAGDHADGGAFAEGYRMVVDRLMAALDKSGVKPIETIGREFDPKTSQAVSHIPSPDYPEHIVIEELRKGYLLGDRLLRPAQVVVSSGATGGKQEPEAD